MMLDNDFFNREPIQVAQDLLGKILRHFFQGIWLSAMIIETEAYYLSEKASHSSLGFTEKRKALFMEPGTIYMYYARGGDSLNVSCQGEGNAVLIKSGIPYREGSAPDMLSLMQKLNPIKKGEQYRKVDRLCSGQTLLCRSLGLKVPDWNKKTFTLGRIQIDDIGYQPRNIIQTTRLGIPKGRDEHLLFRFIDYNYATYCTSNPLTKRHYQADQDFIVHERT